VNNATSCPPAPVVPNTSASGGPLLPLATGPQPLEGQALLDFFQGWLVGMTGLPGVNVTPRAQPEEPNIPQQGICWLAFGINIIEADTFPAIVHDPNGNGGLGWDILRRQETINLLCSFYDLGSGANSGMYAAILRDGLVIQQNLELLTLNGFGYVGTGEQLVVPVLMKSRWLYRIDMGLTVRRSVERAYAVENVLKVTLELIARDATNMITDTITTVPPPA
jgi:hypothetical protein